MHYLITACHFTPINLNFWFTITVCLITGICWQNLEPSWTQWITYGTIIFSFTLQSHPQKHQELKIALILWAFVIGALRYQTLYQDHEQFFAVTQDKECYIRGIISSQNEEPWSQQSPYKTEITLSGLTSNKGILPLPRYHKKIMISSQSLLNAASGDELILGPVVIKKPTQKSYQTYLLKEGLLTHIFLTNKIKVASKKNHAPLTTILNDHKKRILDAFIHKLSPHAFAYCGPLFLGSSAKSTISISSIKNDFQKWGISHYLARSGLHLVLFIYFWELALHLIPLGHRIKHLITVLLCFIYFLLTFSSISFTRAFAAFLILKATLLIGRPINPPHTLTLVTLALLFHNPAILFFVDFQLSFGLAFGLAWLIHIKAIKKAQSFLYTTIH